MSCAPLVTCGECKAFVDIDDVLDTYMTTFRMRAAERSLAHRLLEAKHANACRTIAELQRQTEFDAVSCLSVRRRMYISHFTESARARTARGRKPQQRRGRPATLDERSARCTGETR